VDHAPTDESLFEKYRKGDLASLVGDRQAAEDVFQETFLQIHQSASGFDVQRRFRPWMFTIAANKGRDYLRRKNRRKTVDLSAPVFSSDDGGMEYVDLMAINVPTPDAAMDQRETSAQVQQALEGLSPALREILLLSYFQRLSYAQIADDLNIPLGTVKSRLHAAVAAFAKNWKKVTTDRTEEAPKSS
jgi:RNA polymerase sigma-70 factor, ECF subfamily